MAETGSSAESPYEILALDLALDALRAFDERRAKLLELQLFGGLTYGEMAEALDVSEATVHWELRLARAWMHWRWERQPDPLMTPMMPERWRQVEAHLEAGLDLDAEARRTFLLQSRRHDEASLLELVLERRVRRQRTTGTLSIFHHRRRPFPGGAATGDRGAPGHFPDPRGALRVLDAQSLGPPGRAPLHSCRVARVVELADSSGEEGAPRLPARLDFLDPSIDN